MQPTGRTRDSDSPHPDGALNLPPAPPHGARADAVRVARNSVYGSLARGVDTVMRFIAIPIIARHLGSDLFGSFAFVTAYAAVLMVFADFGVEPIMVREMSARPDQRGAILGSAMTLRFVFSLILLGATLLVILVAGWSSRIGYALTFECAAQLLGQFGIVLVGTLRAYERMEYDLFTCIAHQALMFTLLVGVVLLDLGFVWVFLARAAAECFKTALLLLVIERKFLRLRLNRSLSRMFFLLKEGLPVILLSLLLVLSLRINVFMLKYFRTPAEISYLDIPQRLIMALNMMGTMIVVSVFPVLCRQASATGHVFKLACRKAFKFLAVIALPVSIALAVWAPDIVGLLFGAEYLPSIPVLRITASLLCITFWLPLANFILTAVGRQKTAVWGAVAGLLVNVAASLMLVPRYGHVGAAIAAALSVFTFLCVNLALVFRFACSVPLHSILLRPLLGGVVMLGVGLLFGHGLIRMIAGSCAAFIAYGGALLALRTFSKEEIRTFAALLRRRSPGPPT